jgi:hypothetical protein
MPIFISGIVSIRDSDAARMVYVQSTLPAFVILQDVLLFGSHYTYHEDRLLGL